jgi:hypothetical protein
MVPRLLSTRDHPNFSDSQLSEGRLPFGIIAGPVLALSFSGPAVLTFPPTSRGTFHKRSLMSSDSAKAGGFRLSLDTWAVLLALVLAAAVRFHIFGTVPW